MSFPSHAKSYLRNHLAHKNGSPFKMQVVSCAHGICAYFPTPMECKSHMRLLLGMSLFSRKYSIVLILGYILMYVLKIISRTDPVVYSFIQKNQLRMCKPLIIDVNNAAFGYYQQNQRLKAGYILQRLFQRSGPQKPTQAVLNLGDLNVFEP